MRGSAKYDFQVEDQGGSATPVPEKDHLVDLPPEHVHVRTQARGDLGGVREEASHAGRRLLHICSCAVARPSLDVFLSASVLYTFANDNKLFLAEPRPLLHS